MNFLNMFVFGLTMCVFILQCVYLSYDSAFILQYMCFLLLSLVLHVSKSISITRIVLCHREKFSISDRTKLSKRL